ncbi:unnamed protein product [Ixodes hexagonus]
MSGMAGHWHGPTRKKRTIWCSPSKTWPGGGTSPPFARRLRKPGSAGRMRCGIPSRGTTSKNGRTSGCKRGDSSQERHRSNTLQARCSCVPGSTRRCRTLRNCMRYLLRGLRPEMMERVAISNPRTTQEFLQHLQRLTHVGAMARHALMAMPTHPLPGLHAENPIRAPGYDLGSPPGAAETLGSPTDLFYAPGRHDVPDRSTAAVLGAMQETLRALTAAVDRLGQRDRRPFPPRGSRN